MDAKPVRAWRVRDENAIAMPKNKTLHSRNKSSPALSTMANNGALKVAAKRAAFGDISHTHRGNHLMVESLAGQGENKLTEKKLATLLQPAQKPLSSLSNSAIVPNAKTGQESQVNRVITKRATTIFKDYSTLPQDSIKDKENQPCKSDSIAELYGREKPLVEDKKSKSALPGSNGSLPRSHSQILAGLSNLQIPEPKPRQNAPTVPNVVEAPLSSCRELVLVKNPCALVAPLEEEEVLPLVTTNSELQKTIESFPVQATTVPDHVDSELYGEDEDELNEDDGYVTARSTRSKPDNITEGSLTTLLMPQSSRDIESELEAAAAVVRASTTPADYEDEEWDISMVSDYKEEIFTYYHELETRFAPNPNYMVIQTEIQWSMRSVLIDWIVQVHDRFQLLPETLFLTVNIIDRFLSIKIVSINKLQLVGAVALFIASKYEEVNCPSLKEMIFMVDNSYEEEEIIKAERFMLGLLNFDLGWPGPMSFLRRISTSDDYDIETRTVAKYFLEMTIMDERFLECLPSFLAAGAHCLARLMLNKGHWTPHHVHYSGYTYQQLYPLLLCLLECLEDPVQHHNAIYEKYCTRKFRGAASFAREEMMRGFYPFDHHTNLAMNFEHLWASGNMLEYVYRGVPGYHARPY